MPEYDELYRLSDQDFVNVGCTKEELEHVKQYNQGDARKETCQILR